MGGTGTITGLGLHSHPRLCHHIPSDAKIMGHVVEKKCSNKIERVFKCIINSSKFITENEMVIVCLTAES
jgi:hypothetical protein